MLRVPFIEICLSVGTVSVCLGAEARVAGRVRVKGVAGGRYDQGRLTR